MNRIQLIILTTILYCGTLFSQSDTHQHYYGEIQGREKNLTQNLKISFQYGQNAAVFDLSRKYQYQTSMESFTNMMDAMNFLSAHGWELVDSYVSQDDGDSHLIFHYVVRIDSARLTQMEKKE